MYAIIQTGGKQYKVEKGDQILIEKLELPVGDNVSFDVLLISDDKGIQIGKPIVEGASAKAKVIEHGKGEKVVVFHYKPKKNYRKKYGHRQPYTKVEITAIG